MIRWVELNLVCFLYLYNSSWHVFVLVTIISFGIQNKSSKSYETNLVEAEKMGIRKGLYKGIFEGFYKIYYKIKIFKKKYKSFSKDFTWVYIIAVSVLA